jgi:Na+/melibiose symporter-like transporter
MAWLLLIVFLLSPFLIFFIILYKAQYKIISRKLDDISKQSGEGEKIQNDEPRSS